MGAIADAAGRAPTDAAVYFFIDGRNRVVYIGKAGNLRRRLQGHVKTGGRRFAAVQDVRWMPCPDEETAAGREADLIVGFAPRLNRSLTREGRWVHVDVVPDVARGRVAFTLSPIANGTIPSGGKRYGCFPHLGVGVSSTRGIACSEGYAALLRLVWAASEPDAAAPYPSAISGVSPPNQAVLRFDESFAQGLHRLLSGTGAGLLDGLWSAAEGRRATYQLTALRRDREGAAAFFRHGPAAIRDIRLRHGRPPGPLSREEIVTLWAADVHAAIGDDVTLPATGSRRGRWSSG